MRAKLTIFLVSMLVFSLSYHQAINSMDSHVLEKQQDLPVSNSIDALQHGFIKNEGQLSDSSVHYYIYHGDWLIQFRTSSIRFMRHLNDYQSDTLTFQFRNSNFAIPYGGNELLQKMNYFLGISTFTGVQCYESVIFKDIYDGIDLHYYLNGHGLKYDFIVDPGANPNQICIQLVEDFDVIIEDKSVSVLTTVGKELFDSGIIALQEDIELEAGFLKSPMHDSCYQFAIPNYDPSKSLIIDPLVLSTSSYLGDHRLEDAKGLTIDNEGFIYIVGTVYSIDYSDDNTYITKLNQSGTSIIYTTIIGGSDYDEPVGIGVTQDGCPIIAGMTYSDDFPILNGTRGSSGQWDCFVVKLKQSGSSILYSLLVGDSANEHTRAMTIDDEGNPYVCGWTRSPDFPQVGGLDNGIGGFTNGYAGFVFKLNSNSLNLTYSACFGSVGDYTEPKAIAVNSFGYACVVGRTNGNIPTTEGAFDQTNGGNNDCFIMKINPDGNSLNFSTYLGASQQEIPRGVTIDDDGCVYVTGDTNSADFPLTNEYNDTLGGHTDCFVTKLNASGNSLLFSTFMGSSEYESGSAITIDSNKNVIVAGISSSDSFPVKDPYSASRTGYRDCVIFKLNSTGNGLVFSSYYGGSKDDYVHGVCLNQNGDIIITGDTESNDIPLVNAIDTSYSNQEVFFCIFKHLVLIGPPLITSQDSMTYYEGLPNPPVQWQIYDQYPSFYLIYENESLRENVTWTELSVTVKIEISNLSVGTYNFTIQAFDLDRNSTVSSVLITIIELPPLTIDGPEDLVIESDTSGYAILWNVSSYKYVNYTIYRNGSFLDHGLSFDLNIRLDLGSLSPGTYNYTIIVINSAQEVSDTVFVLVEQATITTTSVTTSIDSTTTGSTGTTNGTTSSFTGSTPDLMILIQLMTFGSVVIILVFSVLICKNRE